MELASLAMIVMTVAIVLTVINMFPGLIPSESLKLQKKMAGLGKIKGRKYDDIIKLVGTPTSYEDNKDGGILCSWNTQKYSINLGFDMDGICTGVFGEKLIK